MRKRSLIILLFLNLFVTTACSTVNTAGNKPGTPATEQTAINLKTAKEVAFSDIVHSSDRSIWFFMDPQHMEINSWFYVLENGTIKVYPQGYQDEKITFETVAKLSEDELYEAVQQSYQHYLQDNIPGGIELYAHLTPTKSAELLSQYTDDVAMSFFNQYVQDTTPIELEFYPHRTYYYYSELSTSYSPEQIEAAASIEDLYSVTTHDFWFYENSFMYEHSGAVFSGLIEGDSGLYFMTKTDNPDLKITLDTEPEESNE